jgi:hypothetical protein
MTLISATIPNLVGGISQQPPALRLTTSCEDMVNTWPSIVSGLQKRPPTRHIANIGTALSAGACGYLIERNEDYRFLAIIENGDLKVLDLNTGSYQTVTFPNGKAYLNTPSPVDAFSFVTFGDFTFMSNNSVTVESDVVAEPVGGATRLNPSNMGTVYVTTAAYNTYYSVYVNGAIKASYLTPSGASGSNAIADTSQIAVEVRNQLNTSGYTTTLNGSTITITNLPAGATLQTQGGNGDKMMRCFIKDVQSFSDLPPTSPEGRIVRVAGDLEALGDDYYVVFEKGIWKETVDWNQGEQLDTATMPHILVRNTDGSWTFKRHVWKGRSVGDTDSSANPSFVGKNINDIFVYTNRLGFLADENIILSEADNYENFYRTTTAQLLDSDMIDLAVLHSNVDVLYHAVPYNRDLLLMSATNQFRFSYQQFLGQRSANIQYSTSFNVSTRVNPLNMGNSIYFVDDRADYSYTKAFEYFPKENVVADDAEDVTAQVPELVPNNIIFTAGSNRAKAIVAYSAESPNSLFVYKYFWSGDRKVQSAWTKWAFTDCTKIYWADFSGTFLYFLIERPNGVCLERMRIDEDVFDTDLNYEILLDRRTQLTGGQMSYSAVTGKTTITLPYSTSLTPEIVSSSTVDNVVGIRQSVTRLSGTQFTVFGDITSYTNTAGLAYNMEYEFSTLFMKQAKGSGEVVILDGRVQLRYLTLEYHNTAFFKTQVITPGRDPALSTFVGFVVGSNENSLGKQSFASGKYRMPLMAENLKARILISNDSPFPSAFGSAEWQAVIALKSQKRL